MSYCNCRTLWQVHKTSTYTTCSEHLRVQGTPATLLRSLDRRTRLQETEYGPRSEVSVFAGACQTPHAEHLCVHDVSNASAFVVLVAVNFLYFSYCMFRLFLSIVQTARTVRGQNDYIQKWRSMCSKSTIVIHLSGCYGDYNGKITRLRLSKDIKGAQSPHLTGTLPSAPERDPSNIFRSSPSVFEESFKDLIWHSKIIIWHLRRLEDFPSALEDLPSL
ncbi:hypothetical protein KSP40_PGU019786 [Platanthera guangdongensis]|uniref:Uncharacterized protein n=1 Tax=Platanthera guangdongensis TaxID=2320717 RepID=A0ABR2MPS2_9ASPA